MCLIFAACLNFSVFISKSRFRHSGDEAYRRANACKGWRVGVRLGGVRTFDSIG